MSLRPMRVLLAAAALSAATLFGGTGPARAADCSWCTVSVSHSTRSEYFSREDRGLMSFEVTLGWTPPTPVVIGYQTVAVGSATAGVDYVAQTGSVTVAAGQTRTWIPVGIRPDTLFESNETFALSLTSTNHGHFAQQHGVGTILDDDPSRLTVLNAEPVAEGDGWMWFLIVLSAPVSSTVNLQYGTLNCGAQAATAGADYLPVTGSLAFAPNQTARWVPVQVIDDSVGGELTEYVCLKLHFATGVSIQDNWGSGAIRDNDVIR